MRPAGWPDAFCAKGRDLARSSCPKLPFVLNLTDKNLQEDFMRNVVLYIAMSLDGYIADAGGRVDWLSAAGGDADGAGYSAFIDGVDTVVMGWNTYEQIVTELSPGAWAYPQLTSYVITHRPLPPTGSIHFVNSDPCSIVQRLKHKPGKSIWICGGRTIIHPLMREGVIDQYRISIIPTILGAGIPLFGALPNEIKLRLTHAQTSFGITQLCYTRI